MSIALRTLNRAFARNGARALAARAFSAEAAVTETRTADVPEKDGKYFATGGWSFPPGPYEYHEPKIMEDEAKLDAMAESEEVKEIALEYGEDAEGELVVTMNDEPIWVPDVARSIEWVLSTPTDLHLFLETPVIKESPQLEDTFGAH